jgi:hypothetical protein
MLNTMPLAVPDEQSMMPHTWHVVMAANRTSGCGDQRCTINKFLIKFAQIISNTMISHHQLQECAVDMETGITQITMISRWRGGWYAHMIPAMQIVTTRRCTVEAGEGHSLPQGEGGWV